jgi:hypothetical protein
MSAGAGGCGWERKQALRVGDEADAVSAALSSYRKVVRMS